MCGKYALNTGNTYIRARHPQNKTQKHWLRAKVLVILFSSGLKLPVYEALSCYCMSLKLILLFKQTKHVKHSLKRESCNHPMFPSSIASGPVNFLIAMCFSVLHIKTYVDANANTCLVHINTCSLHIKTYVLANGNTPTP